MLVLSSPVSFVVQTRTAYTIVSNQIIGTSEAVNDMNLIGAFEDRFNTL